MPRVFACLMLCLPLGAVESTVKIDNPSVRVLSVTYQPGEKSALHAHAGNRVVILLDAGHLATIYEDGRREDQPWTAGEARWVPAGPKHIGENTGSAPIHIIEVEMKKPSPLHPAARSPRLDPVAIDPKHNVLILENNQVRVFRSWREPGAQEMIHAHTGAGRVAVLLTDLDARVMAGGAVSNLRASAGDVLWSGPVRHATKNVGASKFEMIVVEVK